MQGDNILTMLYWQHRYLSVVAKSLQFAIVPEYKFEIASSSWILHFFSSQAVDYFCNNIDSLLGVTRRGQTIVDNALMH